MSQKTVLISGTSTGIGAACVARQAAAGWKVYAGDIGIGGPVELLTEEEWRRQFDVNFFGLVNLTREAMGLVDKAEGRFVHIGSVLGRLSDGGIGPCSASKHAVEAFNWALRNELGRNTKMMSSVIEPGAIRTDIWDKTTSANEEMERRLSDGGLTERYRFLVDVNQGFIKEGKAKGIDADKVAQAVEHALTVPRPKARYLVGADAKAAAALARLPDRAVEKLMGLNQKRLERSGRS